MRLLSVRKHDLVRTALRPEIVRRSLLTAVVVGSILAAINHGVEIVTLDVDPRRLLRVGLTYIVPYCVATYAAVMQELRPRIVEPAPK